MPSLNSRLTANYTSRVLKGNFDLRLERYTENSFHTNDGSMTRERKVEAQVNFNFSTFRTCHGDGRRAAT